MSAYRNKQNSPAQAATPTITSIVLEPFGLYKDSASIGVSSNTTMFLYLFNLPAEMTLGKLTVNVRTVTASGTLKFAIYSEDGATKYMEVTTATISGTGNASTAISSVVLPAGNYWVAVLPVSTTNITLHSWAGDAGSFTFSGLLSDTTSEPDLVGSLTVTASTIPSTITPTSISFSADAAFACRLDN